MLTERNRACAFSVSEMSGRAELLKAKGNKSFKEGNFEEAKTQYLNAIAAAMEEGDRGMSHTIYGNMAHVNNKLGNFKDSEKFARLAIRAKPDWHKGYYRGAQAALQLGRIDDALSLINSGIDNCVENDDLRKLRAEIVESRKSIKKAKTAAPPPPPPPPLVPANSKNHNNGNSKNRNNHVGKRALTPETLKTDVWSSILAEAQPATQLTEAQAAAARAGNPDALKQELCVTARRGSAALRRDQARQAFEEYRRCLQLVAKHRGRLKTSGAEMIALRYCFALACHEVANMDALVSGESELLSLLEHAQKPMPAAYYLLGKIYLRLNRYEQAQHMLQLCDYMLARGARGETYVYPATSDTIPDTEHARRGILQPEVAELLRQSRCPPRPDAQCRLPDCLCLVTVPDPEDVAKRTQQPRRDIYYSDVDFAGFMTVECLDKCKLEYHLACWRKLKDDFGPGTQRTIDKDLLNTACLTPDCGAVICRICTVGADTLEKHELASDEYKQRLQRPSAKHAKQQKKAAVPAQKKQQSVKFRKARDGDAQRDPAREESDAGPQKSASEPSVPSVGEVAAAAAGAATSVAAQPTPAPSAPIGSVPDLREMTVLRRGSDATEVAANKKSKKKKKKGASSRWRAADAYFWGATEEEEVPYNGPPVNVIYSTGAEDLAERLSRMEEIRTLQFSTRSLIPDSSEQPASVPHQEGVSEEEHAMLESAYQFLYDYLKASGPTRLDDSGLLSVTSQLSGQCQQLIAEQESLQNFLLRLPRFYLLDGRICVDADVGAAEAMVGSAIIELLDIPADQSIASSTTDGEMKECGASASASIGAEVQQGETGAEAALDEDPSDDDEPFQFDPVTGELIESDDDDEEEEEDSGQTGDGDPDTNDGAEGDPDSADYDPDYAGYYPDSADPDLDSTDMEDADGGQAVSQLEPYPDMVIKDEDEKAPSPCPPVGPGGQGDGAWKAATNEDGEDTATTAVTAATTATGEQAGELQQLQRELNQLREEKRAADEELRTAKIGRLRLERTVRQLMQTDPAQPPAAGLQSQLDSSQLQLSDAHAQLAAARQQLADSRAEAAQLTERAAESERAATEAGVSAASLQQKLTEAEQQTKQLRERQAAELETLTTERDQAHARLDETRRQHDQERNQWLAEKEQLSMQLQQLAAAEQRAAQLEMQMGEQQARMTEGAMQIHALQQHANLQRSQIEELSAQLEAAAATAGSSAEAAARADLEAARAARLHARLAEAEQQAAGAEEAKRADRSTRARYVSLLSSAGAARLDAAAKRCADAMSSIQRLVEAVGHQPGAVQTTRQLQQADAAIEKTRAQFKETIKMACKAIKSKESVDLQSLKMPDIPDIDAILASAPAFNGGRGVPAPALPTLPRPPRPSSATTASSSDSGGGSGAPVSAPAPLLDAVVPPTATQRPPNPAAQQLSSVTVTSAQPAATPFASLVDEIVAACGAAGSRETVKQQLSLFRSHRGGTMRGISRTQVVTEVAAMVIAETNAKARGATMPVFAPPLVPSQPSREECVMCREYYEPSQAQELRCGHSFHALCLEKWKQQSGGMVALCPICRQPFTSDTDFPEL